MIIDRLTIAPISSPLRLRRSFSVDEARSYIREKAKRVRVGTRERASREYNIIRGRPGRWVPWSVRIIKTRSAATSGFTLSPPSAFNPVPLPLTNHPTSSSLSLLPPILYHSPDAADVSSLSFKVSFLSSLLCLFRSFYWNLFIFPFICPHPLSGRTFRFEDSPFERSSRVRPSPSCLASPNSACPFSLATSPLP